MLTDQEAAGRRELVRQLRSRLWARWEPLRKALIEHGPRYSVPFSGGIGMDDKEAAEHYANWCAKEAAFEAERNAINASWCDIEAVFGVLLCQQAIEEGESRIGSLPYVEQK